MHLFKLKLEMKIIYIVLTACSVGLLLVLTNNSEESYSERSAKLQAAYNGPAYSIMSNDRELVMNNRVDSTLLAPDFTYRNIYGKDFTLSKQRGKVVVVNIWATYCGPCIRELPDFIALQEDLKDQGVLFVGVALDQGGIPIVRPFAEEHHINYPILIDREASILEKYPLQGLPDTYVINRDGEVAHTVITGASEEVLRPLLEELVDMDI